VSWDLYYVATQGRTLDSTAASEYLANLPHCTVQPTAGGGFQAWYEHPDTRVYWNCTYGPPSSDYEPPFDPEKPLPAEFVDAGLSFNRNFMRPQYFGLEAIPFAANIARDLGLKVYDPQDDSEVAEADVSRLTASWMKGNEWASRGQPDARYMDADLAMEMWRYDSRLAEVQSALDALGTSAVVPKIMPLAKRGSKTVLRAIGWSRAPKEKVRNKPCDLERSLQSLRAVA
jgi:hypothetical protein